MVPDPLITLSPAVLAGSDLAFATNCASDISIQAIGQLNKEYPDWLTEFQAW
jgi:hypothetical protein